MVWYAPKEMALSLGITLPFFLFYAWRIYSLILDHMAAMRFFSQEGGVKGMLEESIRFDAFPAALDAGSKGWEQLLLQLGVSTIYGEYERRIGGVRRALRADVYTVILIGFFGTLFGMAGAFALIGEKIYGGLSNPGMLVGELVKGGMATALVSSLVAAVLGGVAMAYLSFTEREVSAARQRLAHMVREYLVSLHARSRQDV